MPIKFQVFKIQGYFLSLWEGKVTDAEILAAYKAFYEGPDWSPQLNELADLSNTDMSVVTSAGLMALQNYVQHLFLNHNVAVTKTAAFCPNDLPYGLARVYAAWTDESPEKIQVFRDIEKARAWLGI